MDSVIDAVFRRVQGFEGKGIWRDTPAPRESSVAAKDTLPTHFPIPAVDPLRSSQNHKARGRGIGGDGLEVQFPQLRYPFSLPLRRVPHAGEHRMLNRTLVWLSWKTGRTASMKTFAQHIVFIY